MFGDSLITGIAERFLCDNNLKAKYILDNNNNKWEKIAYGLAIKKAEEILQPFDDDNRILIASAHVKEMVEQLESYGYRMGKHIVVILDARYALQDFSYLERDDLKSVSKKEIKESYLNLLDFLHLVCSKYNLRYYLAYGSLLGAVRHSGFIPWDDDVDVWMPIEDIYKLGSVIKNENARFGLIGLFTESLCRNLHFSLVDNKYICDFAGIQQVTTGNAIDIFPLIGITDNSQCVIRKLDELQVNSYHEGISSDNKCLDAKKELMDELLCLSVNEGKEVFTLPQMYTREPFNKNWFEPFATLNFENLSLRAPKSFHIMLTILYGDYMKPKRDNMHGHKVYFNDYSQNSY